MKYFLDTHILIWHAEESSLLNSNVLAIIRNPANIVYVSHASFWEIVIKSSIGKLKMSVSLLELRRLVIQNQFQILDFDFKHYETFESLPFFHNDPFDRMLIAQAIAEDMTLITQDDKLAPYQPQVSILWN
ncbi:type II toxin-antitoxin system VapC family toxin [Telluribacter sp.]|jgi:PIN domain nuclease of toxin-antitoxin system|uniref:type II toxin-antitoxin system VapC family toxin n=1 Tax=Telluribacter sp. TaxID=1978767 RepID=UPI002E0DEA25|nr:type II toxin-antitoxin system VapC family toxin [Telluribacter sp.]